MDITLVKKYLDNNLPIIPLKGKIPIGSATKWQKKQLPHKTVLQGLAKSANNIGCATGKLSGIVCIDIDTKRDGMSWYEAHKTELEGGIIETTGTGGLHILFKLSNQDIKSSKDKIAPGVEVLSDGRYFVTAPSVHPDTQKPYTIHNDLTLLDVLAEAKEVPSWLIEKYNPEKEEVKETNITIKTNPMNLSFAKAALNGYRATEGDSGDVTTFKACCLGVNHAINYEDWFPQIMEWNKTHCTPPWSQEDLIKKMESAYKNHKLPVGYMTPDYDFDDTPVTTTNGNGEKTKGVGKVIGTVASGVPINGYNFKNPNVCANLMLNDQFKDDLVYFGEDFYFYQRDNWEKLTPEFMSSLIRMKILTSHDDVVNVKSCHIQEIIKSLRDKLIAAGKTYTLNTRIDNKKGDFIRLENGILNLNTGVLESHTNKWFSTTKLPFSYNHTAQCDQWHSFLETLFGDDEQTKKALQCFMGYCISNSYRFQKLGMFLGPSRAGKGVISRLLEEMLGEENKVAVSFTGLGDTFGLQPLIGKKVAFFNDAHKGHNQLADIALERIKNVSGHDAVSINRKNQGQLTVRLATKFLIVANGLPGFIDTQSAFKSRLLIFVFKKSFAGKEDIHLEERLRTELPGILNWCMQGLQELQELPSLPVPTGQAETLRDVEAALSPIKGFIAEELDIPEEEPENVGIWRACTDELYTRYTGWCEMNGRHPKSKGQFLMELKADPAMPEWLEHKQVRIGGGNRSRVLQGIALKPEDIEDFDELPSNHSVGQAKCPF